MENEQLNNSTPTAQPAAQVTSSTPPASAAPAPMLSSTSKIVLSIVVVVILIGAGYMFWSGREDQQQANNPAQKTPITILWADWAPADSLETLVKDFTKETGIPVQVQRKPWNDFQNYTFSVLDAKKHDFDLVVGDSQWLGRGSRSGHYVELTQFVTKNNLQNTMLPVAVQGYGEYPKGSGKYWAVPLEGDALGFAYRKDLFEAPAEQKAFKEKYGYDLAVPTTWDQVGDIAEFFQRPAENFYGIGVLTGIGGDPLTMGVEDLIWAWGGSLGDYTTHRSKGMLNSKDSVAGLEFYKKLYKLSPPGYANAAYQDPLSDFEKGRIAMFFDYFAFFPELEDKTKNPFYEQTDYFKMPAGPKAQVASLGGQGVSINSYTANKDEAFIFLDWFIRDDVQQKWAVLGGFSTSKKVLASDAFLNDGARFNKAFAESMTMMKDFWTDPEYADLLIASQKQWNDYITKNIPSSAQETMNNLARDWENIFEYAGYYKE